MKSRKEMWLAVLVLGIGAIPLAVLGIWAYMSITATPLHPNAAEVPSRAGVAPSTEWTGAVDLGRQMVRAHLAERNLPGLSVAVGFGGSVVWAEGFGWANLENRVPVTPETTFRIGTASVVLTSAAAGLLLEQERLRLDDEIKTYVPEFPYTEWTVTLGQLMGHVAGVPNDGGDEGPLFAKGCERPADAFQFLSGFERQLRFEPGTRFAYSSYGWIAVAAAVEAASHERFVSFMQRRIFEPLGMDRTDADSATEPGPSQATSYFPRFMADTRYGLDRMRPLELSCYGGAGVFASTPSDLVRFGMAINAGRLLRPATVDLLQRSQRLQSGEDTGYGLGWDLEPVTLGGREVVSVGHMGGLLGGPVASFISFPEEGIVVSVIANSSYADPRPLAASIAEAFEAIHRRP